MPLPQQGVTQALGDYLAIHPAFKEHFGESPHSATELRKEATRMVGDEGPKK